LRSIHSKYDYRLGRDVVTIELASNEFVGKYICSQCGSDWVTGRSVMDEYDVCKNCGHSAAAFKEIKIVREAEVT